LHFVIEAKPTFLRQLVADATESFDFSRQFIELIRVDAQNIDL
jgi:hypothetical protein